MLKNLSPIKKKLLIVFAVGLGLLIVCLVMAGKGKLLPAILLFPSYLLMYPYNDTFAGIIGTLQFPLYFYANTLGNTKKTKLLIVLITVLAHLLMVNAVIKPR